MKRWSIPADATTTDAIELEEVEVPEPGRGQVRIRVTALAINARDDLILTGPFGRTPGQPLVPLSDVAGRIDAVGAGVTGWAVGDRVMLAHVPSWVDGPPPVFGPGPGSLDDPGFAVEQIVVEADRLIDPPASLDDAEAATLQVAGVTAWNALFGARAVHEGDKVLVVGAGGVSVYAAQLAGALGATVVAAVRHGADDPRWAAIGVTQVVSSLRDGWGASVLESTGGVAKVVNTVGGSLVAESLAALRSGGEVAVPGLYDLSAPVVDVLGMIGAQTTLRGVAVGSVTMHRDLAAFVDKHAIRPVIQRRVSFDVLPQAYSSPSDDSVFGKTVVDFS